MPRTSYLFASALVVILALLAVACAPAATPTVAPSAPTVAPTSPPAAPPTPSDAGRTAATTAPATPTSVPATPTTSSASSLPSCTTGSLALSTIQTPVPVTPAPTVPPTLAPTLDPSAPTPTARPATTTPRPAPQADHVGFPDGYQTSFKFMGTSDRVDNKQVRVICGNDKALSTKRGEPYAYGSILVFESWRPKEDSSGNVIKDANGHFIREALTTLFVMRKEQGFGEAYQNLRNGEWEYVAYRPDKSVATPPQATSSCAACHLGVGSEYDFVLRDDIFTSKDHYLQNPPVDANVIGMWSMAFYPRPYMVKVGTTVKFVNHDRVTHNIQTADKSIDSGPIVPNTEFSFKFDKPGIYDYICSIHPLSMSARIDVKE